MAELTLEADARSLGQSGSYAFYCFQIVKFTATLASDKNSDVGNSWVVFDNIGSKPGLNLQPYGKEDVDWFKVPGRTDQVQVPLKPVEPGQGVAVLHALVVGPVLTQGEVTASIPPKYASPSLSFSTFGVTAPVTSYPGVLAASTVDQTPSSSNGNYLNYTFQVTTDGKDGQPKFTGLPNMCIRLTAAGAAATSDFLRNICLYKNYADTTPLVIDGENAPLYVDLITDTGGVAELYACARGGKTASASLSCQAGIVEPEIGPILVVDATGFGTGLTPPSCDDPVDLGQAGIATIEADIPQDYPRANSSDQIFLFCNGRFQSFGALSELQLPFQSACLRSESSKYGDDTDNALYYVASNSAAVRVSTVFPFLATGTPPTADLAPVSARYDVTLAAPTILEAADGWPINCESMRDGLTVNVPMDQRLTLGDQILIHMAVKGYRLASNEPTGWNVPVPGDSAPMPSTLIVTSHAVEQGSIQWRFQPFHFTGFGELQSPDETLGSLGTLAIRYCVRREGVGVAYRSDILSISIDTIPPNGQYGLSDGIQTVVSFK